MCASVSILNFFRLRFESSPPHHRTVLLFSAIAQYTNTVCTVHSTFQLIRMTANQDVNEHIRYTLAKWSNWQGFTSFWMPKVQWIKLHDLYFDFRHDCSLCRIIRIVQCNFSSSSVTNTIRMEPNKAIKCKIDIFLSYDAKSLHISLAVIRNHRNNHKKRWPAFVCVCVFNSKERKRVKHAYSTIANVNFFYTQNSMAVIIIVRNSYSADGMRKRN